MKYSIAKLVKSTFFVSFLLIFFPAALAQAASTTQTFTSEWTVSPWDYYGDFAAMEWHYTPYEPWDESIGNLQVVEVETEISGQRQQVTEPVRIRYSFVTGWSPADYQLYREFYIPAGETDFSHSESFRYDSEIELLGWVEWEDYGFVPSGHYYFESRTETATHSIAATTTLTFIYNSPEIVIDGLFGSIDEMVILGSMSENTAKPLVKRLDMALFDIASMRAEKACKDLEHFIKFVGKMSGSNISVDDANFLLSKTETAQRYLECN